MRQENWGLSWPCMKSYSTNCLYKIKNSSRGSNTGNRKRKNSLSSSNPSKIRCWLEIGFHNRCITNLKRNFCLSNLLTIQLQCSDHSQISVYIHKDFNNIPLQVHRWCNTCCPKIQQETLYLYARITWTSHLKTPVGRVIYWSRLGHIHVYQHTIKILKSSSWGNDHSHKFNQPGKKTSQESICLQLQVALITQLPIVNNNNNLFKRIVGMTHTLNKHTTITSTTILTNLLNEVLYHHHNHHYPYKVLIGSSNLKKLIIRYALICCTDCV